MFLFPLAFAGLATSILVPLSPSSGEAHFLAWFIAIGLCDGPHVYSTLFRTYFDKEEFQKRKWVYIITPFALFALHFFLYQISSRIFWYYYAYFAIFHFVRQQYGWMMIVGRQIGVSKLERLFDQLAIYSATIFPLLWKHASHTTYGWFIPNDLIQILPISWAQVLEIFYWIISITYLVHLKTRRKGNSKSLLIWLSTWISWSAGFYWFENYSVSLILIAITHGTPYMLLLYPFKESFQLLNKKSRYIPFLFYGFLLVASSLEATLWIIFEDFFRLPLTAIIISILAIPDTAHFVFDTYIWKIKFNPNLKKQIPRL